MKSSVAIVANYNKTLFFKKIADQLENQQLESNSVKGGGVTVFWICVSKVWYQRLLQDGVEASKILYLPRSIVDSEQKNEQIDAPEMKHHYRLNELIYSDRVLRHEVGFGEKYLLAIQKTLREFISTHQIKYIFGESTWAHEILLNRMCLNEAELNCRYLKPHTIRIPNQRFAFFGDEFESQLHEVKTGIEKEWEFELKKPDYFHLNDKKNKLSTRLFGLFRNVALALSPEKHDRQDPTQRLSRLRFFSSKLLSEFNYYIYKLFVKTKTADDLPNKFWVYYLHKQPEASIDVVGRYFEDQYANILRLTRMLPDNCHLLVKEHSNAIGDRPYGFYQKIKQLNRVDLIDERTDSFVLIERAEKTVTVSGTVAYEAGLLNKSTLIFSQAFFSTLPSVETIQPNSQEKMSVRAFKKHLYKNSFEGVISDPISDVRCMSPDNIQRVSQAFMQVIDND